MGTQSSNGCGDKGIKNINLIGMRMRIEIINGDGG